MFLVLASGGITGSAAAASPGPGDGYHADWLERTASPAVDFFRYANGAWIDANPIPPDRAYFGVDTVLEQDNQNFIRGLVESLAGAGTPAADEDLRKVGDFYASGMNERAIDAAGLGPLQPELARLDAVTTRGELIDEIAHLHTLGLGAPWQIGQMQDFLDSTRVIAVAAQGGLGLPNRDYYLKDARTYRNARQAYVAHVARLFVLAGAAPAPAAAQARSVMAFETRLAKASTSDIAQRNPTAVYHPMSVAAGSARLSHLELHRYLSAVGLAGIDTFNLAMPSFFAQIDSELAHTSLPEWRTYLRCQLLDAYAPYLSTPFVDESFVMTKVLTGTQTPRERWLRVLRVEDDALGFAIGRAYVAQRFAPQARAAATRMVERIRDALQADLATLDWMSPATRAAARKKLELMELRIGYPDSWRDYSALKIDRGSFALNVMRARKFEFDRELKKIGRPVDRSDWLMTPQTVNAYYDPSLNSLNVPAGILQPPFFDVSWPDAVNYGATGATLGHEMTHGFDDEGARFDGSGNLRDWWAAADLKRFHAATRCIADQFSQYPVGAGMHVQGALVTGEAVADLGGLILAWRAFRALDVADRSRAAFGGEAAPGFTPDQQFFIAFAHSWAGSIRPEQAEEMVSVDPHPPVQYRANATLANSPEFQTAFGITAPSPMVKGNRCAIW